MIKCENGNVSYGGYKITMQAELCTLIHALIVKGVFTPEEIDVCVAEAKRTDEETDAELEKLESEASPGQVALARLLAQLLSES